MRLNPTPSQACFENIHMHIECLHPRKRPEVDRADKVERGAFHHK